MLSVCNFVFFDTLGNGKKIIEWLPGIIIQVENNPFVGIVIFTFVPPFSIQKKGGTNSFLLPTSSLLYDKEQVGSRYE